MQGEFRVDATRDTFNPTKHFLRVLMQQGRVQLDADWNEQTNILLHYLQTLGSDLMGPHAGTNENDFKINVDTDLKNDFLITPGHYYVHGRLCELESIELEIVDFSTNTQIKVSPWSEQSFLLKKNQWIYLIYQKAGNQPPEKKLVRLSEVVPAKHTLTLDLKDNTWKNFFDNRAEGEVLIIRCSSTYTTQPNHSPQKLENNKTYLVYLDVWERHITFIQDESDIFPGIREVALGGVDTTTRSQLVWQIRVKPVDPVVGEEKPFQDYDKFLQELTSSEGLLGTGNGRIKARAKQVASDNTDPCIIAPDARYRSTQNQLYRVEIHNEGKANVATFKWSRENSSVVFPLLAPIQVGTSETITVTISYLGSDSRFSLIEGDWIEIIDDDYTLQNRAEPLFKVTKIERGADFKITLTRTQKQDSTIGQDMTKHPYLRRWDQKGDPDLGGVLQVVEQTDVWTTLERGIQIQFQPSKSIYQTGDYWLIPARIATGDIEWVGPIDNPAAVPPHGIEHHYAPLAVIAMDAEGVASLNYNCRRKLKQNWENF